MKNRTRTKKRILTTRKILPKLNLLCSNDQLRPILNYILITRSFIVATDSHSLIEMPTDSYFDNDFIDNIPDRILVHSKQWQLLTRPFHFLGYDKQKQSIVVYYFTHKINLPIETEETLGVNYPKYEEIFIATSEKLPSIRIRASYLYKISKIVNDDRLMLKFNRPGSYVKISAPDFNARIIVMPLMDLE